MHEMTTNGAGEDRRQKRNVVREYINCINVEPAILLSSISMGLFGTVLPIFLYFARCVEIYSPHKADDIFTYCDTLTGRTGNNSISNEIFLNMSFEEQQDKVQIDVATLTMWVRAFRCLPAIISSVLLGAWSDGAGGRKQTLMWSYSGCCLGNIIFLILTLIYTKTSIYVWVIIEEMIAGLTGAGMTEFAIQMSMVTDVARDESDKTISLRVSIATGLSSVGSLIGSMATSLFNKYSSEDKSYFNAVLFCTIFYFAGVVYTYFFVRDTFTGEESKLRNREEKSALISKCFTIFKCRFLEVRQTLIRERPGWTRLALNITVVLVFVDLLALDNGLFMLYVKRAPLVWSDVDFTNYVVFIGVVRAAGQMFVWPLLIHRYSRVGLDSIMIIVGLVFAIASYALLSISTSSIMVYSSGALSFVSSMMSPGFRAFIPKLVNKNETARIYTALGIVVMIAPILSSLLFNSIYLATLHIWAGFAFALVALIQALVLILMIIVHCLMLLTWRQSTNVDDLNRLYITEEDFNDELTASVAVDALVTHELSDVTLTHPTHI